MTVPAHVTVLIIPVPSACVRMTMKNNKRAKEVAVIQAARKLVRELQPFRAATVPELDFAPWVPAFDQLEDELYELDHIRKENE